MSFLDNAGTIILDAVLTDTGRKRMAQGNFKVAKFALGDDEVDYTLYNLGGTPAADYETTSISKRIISQSCFEAYADENAAITYGLLSYARDDLLYLPVLKQNEKLAGTLKKGTDDFYYLAVNEETATKLLTETNMGSYDYFLRNNSVSSTKLIVESGLDAVQVVNSAEEPVLQRTDVYRDAFIMETNLYDRYFNIYCDSRFYNLVMGPTAQSTFTNNLQGKVRVNFQLLHPSPPTSFTQILDKYTCYIVEGVPNLIFDPSQMGGSGTDDLTVSAIRGPRGSVTAINFKVVDEFSAPSGSTADSKFTIFGKTEQTLFGGSNKYDYIDSPIYIEGTTSGARLQVPVRIIRYVGT